MKTLRRNLVLGLAGAALALSLAGCAYTDHFGGRTETYGEVAATSRDVMILTNVIRASHSEPLSFVSVGTINGSGAAQSTLGLPPVVFGPHVAAQSALDHALQAQTIFGGSVAGGNGFVGNSVNASVQTQFQVTPVETKEFYEGLLRNVSPRILQLFIEQGIARELLFYLFTDRIILTTPAGKFQYVNDPLDPDFPRFVHFVKEAMKFGLTSEPQPHQAQQASGGANEKTSGAENSENWQLCFSDIYREKNLPEASNAPKCGGKVNAPDARTVQFRLQNGAGPLVKLSVLPRSPFGIFQYLGRITAMGEKGQVHLQSAEAVDRASFRDEILFDVVNVSSGATVEGGCYLTLNYEGQDYCIPNRAVNTKRVLGLLTQLIALNTAISDIPVTPTVRIVQ
ncbi:hypothetical protein [Rhodoblastus sp.]|uniref:hypothetical protein n=1 Tax=Rhodoblastus sp. TaxID=1962975 RepID=UPI003F954A32